MGCSTTTAMYLNVSTEICASASASRSGNTVTVSGTFTVTQGSSWNYNAIYAYVDGHTSWVKVKPYVQSGGTWSENFSFSFEDSGSGNPTYTAIFQVWNNAESGTVGNPASTTFSVSYPSGATTPPQPTVTLVQAYTYGAKFNVSGDYGTPSSASGRYIEAAILDQNSYGNTYKYNIASNTSSADIIVTNSTYQGGGLTILPNKQYYYGGYINNTERNNSVVTGQFVTLPEVAVASITKVGSDMAQFSWTVEADGGHYDKTVSYSLDDGSYTTIDTYSGGSARSGNEVLLGLSPNTQYILNMKNATTAGVSIKGTRVFTLSAEPTITQKDQTLNSVTIQYEFPADGGASNKTLTYSIDGGVTWVQAATVTTSSATTGTFTITGLEPAHAYNLITKVTTTGGTITLDDIAIYTLANHRKFYGSAQEATGYSFSYSNLTDTNNIIGEGN